MHNVHDFVFLLGSRLMSDLWYVRTAKRHRGPFETSKLFGLAAEGKIKPGTFVSCDDKQTWIKAAKIKGIVFEVREPAKRKPKPKRDVASKPANPVWDPRYGGATAERHRDVVDSFGDKLAERGDMTLVRLCYSVGGVVTAASGTYGLIELLQWLEIIPIGTIEESLFVRIGIPVIAAVLAFCGAWWHSGMLFAPPSKITHDMTDEQIADALREQ